MSDPVRIDFGTQSNPGRYGADTGPRHINAYVEQIIEGQPPLPIYATSGLDLFATVSGGGPCRGMIVLDNNIVAVSGSELVSLDSSGSVTLISGIPGTNNVFMARNEKASTPQVAIVVDGLSYILENNILTAVNDPDLPPPTSVTYLDQRIIYSVPDGRFFWSDINNAGSIDALSFSSAEGAPDGLLRVFTHRLDLWLFGSETIELWRSTTNADSPFQRAGGGFLPKGCSAAYSVDHLGEVIFWVGNDNVVYGAQGYSPTPISHAAISRDLKAITDRNSIVGFSYYDGGAGFYCLTTPSWTWIYNVTTGKWFESQSYNMANWRCQFAVNFNGKTILGGNSGGLFYALNPDTFDENGANHVWTLQSAPMHSYPNRISVDRLHVDIIPGVGLNSTDVHTNDPKIGLRWSDDGRKSFSRQILKSIGPQGKYMTRVTFNGLGSTGREGRIWELQVSAPVARGLRYAAIEGGPIGT